VGPPTTYSLAHCVWLVKFGVSANRVLLNIETFPAEISKRFQFVDIFFEVDELFILSLPRYDKSVRVAARGCHPRTAAHPKQHFSSLTQDNNSSS